MINYYGRFILAFAFVCAPLNKLRCKDTPWHWSDGYFVTLEHPKQMLAEKTWLVYFVQVKPMLYIATGVWPNGVWAFFSNTLSSYRVPLQDAQPGRDRLYASRERSVVVQKFSIKWSLLHDSKYDDRHRRVMQIMQDSYLHSKGNSTFLA